MYGRPSALFDALVQMRRRSPASCKADDIVAGRREGPGDAGAETLGGACQEQSAAAGTVQRLQIQCRMLARMAICASQPAVNASVRARGMPATSRQPCSGIQPILAKMVRKNRKLYFDKV